MLLSHFWMTKDIAPGRSNIEISPYSIPGKGNAAAWHLSSDSDAGFGGWLCSCLRFSHRRAVGPCAGPAPEVELEEIPSSCLRSGLRFSFGVHDGG